MEVAERTFADWYRRNRERSTRIFDLLTDDAYYSQPIALRHPIVFYEGHLPAFSYNTLIKRALGRQSIDPKLERLFARGIDPSEPRPASGDPRDEWPARDQVKAFAAEADRQVLDVLEREELNRPGHALLDGAEAAFAILEHEAMHQETLLYMWHRLPFEQKRKPEGYAPQIKGTDARPQWVDVPGGQVTLGEDRRAIAFGWDNESPRCTADVAPFRIGRYNVSNESYLEFVNAGGYSEPKWWRPEDWAWVQREHIAHPLFWERRDAGWFWRGMFDLVALPMGWPAYVSHAEGAAFARWRGARLPTEAEFQRAAFGAPDEEPRRYPWGGAEPERAHGVFDFSAWDPEPVGTHTAGTSAWGVEDLVGNGWEWTSTPFAPFPGFSAMASYPEYSADFFDGEHYVMKGASPATARELLRPTFRNWFRPHYPYVYATFRLARDLS